MVQGGMKTCEFSVSTLVPQSWVTVWWKAKGTDSER